VVPSVISCSTNGVIARASLLQNLWRQFFITELQSQVIGAGICSNSLNSGESENCNLTIGLRIKDTNDETVSLIFKQMVSSELFRNPQFHEGLPVTTFHSWLKTWEQTTGERQATRTFVVDHMLHPKSNEIELYLSIV